MLKHNREFQQVYRQGKSAHSGALVLFYLPQPTTISVGFTASKKVGNAVLRNRAKRRMRALFRAFEARMAAGRYVFVAKAATAEVPYDVLEKAMAKLLRQAGALK